MHKSFRSSLLIFILPTLLFSILPSALAAGLPDEESSPDHMHYWAIYNRFGMTVIYDTAFADEDAYIYAVVVNA